MTKVQLEAPARAEANGQAKKIIASGFIPAVVYGAGQANVNIKVKRHDFDKAFKLAGEFNLIDLVVTGGREIKVIVKEVQKDGLTDKIIHVDFYQVDMAKKITTEIPLNFIGEAKAIKDLGGTLVKNMDAVEVRCLPGDLVSQIDVDISNLDNFDQFIRLHDLTMPAGVELAQETNEAVIGVVETKVKVEAPALSEAAPVEGQVAPAEAAEQVEADKQA